MNIFQRMWLKIKSIRWTSIKWKMLSAVHWLRRFYFKKPENAVDFSYIILKFLITVYLIGLIFFAIVLYGFHWDNRSTQIAVKIYPYPAAIVDGHVIWLKDLRKQVSYVKSFYEKTSQPVDDKNQLTKRVLEQMIDIKILNIQAKKLKVSISKGDLDEAWKKVLSEVPGGKEEVQKVLAGVYGMTEKEFEKLLTDQIVKDKIQTEKIAQVRVSHILIKDEGRAKEVLDRAKKGEDFAALAKEFSEDTASKDKGGSLDWFTRGTMVPDFENAAFNLQPGQISDLVKTEFGFHIIKLEEKRGYIQKSFNDWFNEIKKKTLVWRFV